MYRQEIEEQVLNSEYRKKLIDSILSTSNKLRKNESVKAYDVYKNKLKKRVEEKLKEYIKTDKLKQMCIVHFMGFCEKIINDEASIYLDSPVREFEGISDNQKKTLELVYKDMNYNNKAKVHNRFFKLLGQSPSYIVPKNRKLVKKNLLAHHYDIIENPDDIENPIGYVLSNFNQTNEKDNQRFIFWTRNYNFTTDGNGRMLTDQDNMGNPIKPIIPFSMASKDTDGAVYTDDESTEVEFTLMINAAITELYHIMRMQGFSVPVLKLPNNMQTPLLLPVEADEESSDLKSIDETSKKNEQALNIGTNDMLTLFQDDQGRGADFSFVSPSPDLAGSIEVLSVILSGYLTSKGIDPSVINIKGTSVKSFTSGWDRFLSLVDQFKATQDDFEEFKKVEQNDYKIICRWLNALSNDENQLAEIYRTSIIPEKSVLNIKFYEPQNIKTEKETIDINTSAEEKGYQSRIMSIKKIYGYDSDEKAIEHLNEMKKHKEELDKIEGVTIVENSED